MRGARVTGSESAVIARNFSISGLFTALDNLAIEKRIGSLRGVHHVQVNPAAVAASVMFDPAIVTEQKLIQKIRDCGVHCRGVAVPNHVCQAEDKPAAGAGHHAHHEASQPSGSAPMAGHDLHADMGHGQVAT